MNLFEINERNNRRAESKAWWECVKGCACDRCTTMRGGNPATIFADAESREREMLVETTRKANEALDDAERR